MKILKYASGTLLLIMGCFATTAYAKTYKQCVSGEFGVGYVADVKWYDASKVQFNSNKNVVSLPEPLQRSKVAVFENDCYTSSKPTYMTIRAMGNENASLVTAGAAGVLTGGGLGGLCLVYASPAAAKGCIEGSIEAGKLVGGAVKYALPGDKGVFWQGTALQVELHGTVWNPEAVVTKRIKGLMESNAFAFSCNGFLEPKLGDNAGTKSKLTMEFFSESETLGTTEAEGCFLSALAISMPTKKVTHVDVTAHGDDALWIDYATLYADIAGKIEQWGAPGGKGYCLSTDPDDASSWKSHNLIDKKGCFRKVRFDVASGDVSGYK